MLGKYWEHFPHDADIGIRGIGATKEEAFEQAAVALTAVVADSHRIAPQDEVAVDCVAPDDERLLVEWLNSLIYRMTAHGMLFSRFEVRIDGTHLRGRAWGEAVGAGGRKPAIEVKGASHTQLNVMRDETGTWLAQCVIDI